MAQFNFNAYQYDPSAVGGGMVLEPGKYICAIHESAIKPTKANNGTILELTFKVLSGPATGATFKNNYNIANPSAQAVQIAMNELAAVGVACGRPQIVDTAQWHGANLMVELVKTARSDGKGDANDVIGYFDVNGNAPSKPAQGQQPPQGQPQQQAPAQQPAASQPQTSAPWQGGAPAAGQPPAGGTSTPPWQQGA